jgi:hypothetical protein
MIGRRRHRAAIATSVGADLGRIGRRTRWARLVLAVVAVGLVALCWTLARTLDTRPSTYFTEGIGGIVVLDLSTSVDPNKYRRVVRVLTSLSATGSRTGLVVFSDSAYEVLPPGTRGEELRALLPFFDRPPPGSFAQQRRERRAGRDDPGSPWSASFRGGTRISTGLVVAREMVERERSSDLTVVLVSDLDDSGFDTPALTAELARYERRGMDLRVVPLFPAPEDRQLFSQLLGNEAFVQNVELLRNSRAEERRTLVATFPAELVAAAAALLLLLASNERLLGRLTWRRVAA